MSFVQFSSEKKSRVKRTKSTSARKGQWDNTTSDLSVYKATPEELKLRKLHATSKNIDTVRQELEEKRLKAARQQQHQTLRNSADRTGRGYAFCSGIGSTSNGVARELIYDSEQYLSLLSKTDEALTIARDVLGEDGKRMQAYPAVTPAPGFDELSERPDGTILTHPAPPTKLETLNSTVMQQTALNDTDVPDEVDCNDYDTGYRNGIYDSIEGDVSGSEAVDVSGLCAPQDCGTPDSRLKLLAKGRGSSPRGRSRRSSQRDRLSSVARDTLQPAVHKSNDISLMLQNVEKELTDLSTHVGARPGSQQLRPGTFAGYTATMVNVNSELVFCMKHVNMKLQAEVTARERLEAEVSSQRKLIDGLTEDLLDVQEKLSGVLSELHEFRHRAAVAPIVRTDAVGCVGPSITTSALSTAVSKRPERDETSGRSRDHATAAAAACSTAVEHSDRVHVAYGMDPAICSAPADDAYSLQHSAPQTTTWQAVEPQPGQRLSADLFAQLNTSEDPSEHAACDGLPATGISVDGTAQQPFVMGQPRQVLQAWPFDAGNKESSPSSSSTLKSSMAVLQKQIDLLNKEHTQAVGRFKQLQQLQENLTVTKVPASETS